jgi:hypothetical protein
MLSASGQYYSVHKIIARLFVPNPRPDWNVVDHIDNDKVNNRSSNLRWCTQAMNLLNRRTQGCYWNRRYRKWMAFFSYVGQKIKVGRFDSMVEASEATHHAKMELLRRLYGEDRSQD